MRDGDGTPRRFTVVSWPNRGPKRTDQQEQRTPTRDRVAAGALVVAGAIIAGVIVGGAVVVYGAQFDFALEHNGGDRTAAAIQAAVPEAVWVAMSALGLSQALRGRSSLRATLSIALFFSLSLAAQLLHAEQTNEGYLVAAITPIALALMLEALLHGVRHWALSRDGQDAETVPLLVRVVRGLVVVLVMPWAWLLRLVLDRKATAAGMREWLLDVIPYAPGRTRAQDRAQAALEQAGLAEQERTEIEARAEERVAAADAAAEEKARQAAAAHEQEAERLRAEVERLRTATDTEHARALAAERQRAQQEHNAAAAATAETQRLRGELDAVRRLLSVRQQVELLYDELGRRGDVRHGVPEEVDRVADDIYAQVDVENAGTVRRYLREYLTKTGQAESRVTGVNGAMIETGGAR